VAFIVDQETIAININSVLNQVSSASQTECDCLGCRARVALRRVRYEHPNDYVRQFFGLSRELKLPAAIVYVPGKGFMVDVDGITNRVPSYFDNEANAAAAGIGLVSMAVRHILQDEVLMGERDAF